MSWPRCPRHIYCIALIAERLLKQGIKLQLSIPLVHAIRVPILGIHGCCSSPYCTLQSSIL